MRNSQLTGTFHKTRDKNTTEYKLYNSETHIQKTSIQLKHVEYGNTHLYNEDENHSLRENSLNKEFYQYLQIHYRNNNCFFKQQPNFDIDVEPIIENFKQPRHDSITNPLEQSQVRNLIVENYNIDSFNEVTGLLLHSLLHELDAYQYDLQWNNSSCVSNNISFLIGTLVANHDYTVDSFKSDAWIESAVQQNHVETNC